MPFVYVDKEDFYEIMQNFDSTVFTPEAAEAVWRRLADLEVFNGEPLIIDPQEIAQQYRRFSLGEWVQLTGDDAGTINEAVEKINGRGGWARTTGYGEFVVLMP
ncbi:TPA_asm: hypothetical protein vir526_00003 [Caudoviricetes sp. vir526]|nr:TPA_asm: hypothetical protein vir526_00003 [Caudoviricetes sp. vir526]